MVGIWIKCKLNSTVLKAISRPIKCPDPILKDSRVKAHLKRYWAAGAVSRKTNGLNSLTRFMDFLETSGYPSYEWDLSPALMSPDYILPIVLLGAAKV